MSLFASRLARLGTENAFAVADDIRRAEAAGQNVIRLNLGEPDFDSAGFVNRVAQAAIDQGDTHYVDPQGLPGLRQAVARDLAASRGVEVDPERVVITSGGKPPIGYSLLTYVEPGEEVIYPSPGFPIYESWANFAKAVPKPLILREEKAFRFSARELEPLVSKKTKLVIINSPSNPTGGVLTADDLGEIAELLLDKAHPDFRVLSDEVYDSIVFDGAGHQSIISRPGMREHTVLMNSLSKSYAMTGWRVGYAVLPSRQEARVFRQWNINTYSCTPPFVQAAATEALSNPDGRRNANQMRDQFQKRRDLVVGALNKVEGMTCAMPAGAFYAFPSVSGVCQNLSVHQAYAELPQGVAAQLTPSALFQLFALYCHGVATLDRSAFGRIGADGQYFLRISTASNRDTLAQGVERLASAAVDRAGFASFMASHEFFPA